MGFVWVAIALAAAACTPIGDVTQGPGGGEGSRPSGQRCDVDEDCLVRSPCIAVRCEAHSCIDTPVPEGTALLDDQQVQGDCKKFVCDGRGLARNRPDDRDVPSDYGNACHESSCDNGQPKMSDAADSTVCNITGVCSAGSCSVCTEGKDCTRADDCTIHRYRCQSGGMSCEDTGMPLPARACGVGKVCDAGSCIPCSVGGECKIDAACQGGKIVSCEGGLVCAPQALTGPSCGTDGAGQTLFCLSGECTASCRSDPCSTAPGPCQDSRWDCTTGSQPTCVNVAREDGTVCGDAASCHAGRCERTALVNGDFARGLSGWKSTGDAAKFVVAADLDDFGRLTLSTEDVSTGAAARGTLSQEFNVPADALALRFVVAGGHAHVRLRDGYGNLLQDCVGLDSDLRIPVNWDLSRLRGQHLTLAIEDDQVAGEWAFVKVSGFDVIREIETTLRNSQFLDGFSGWETTGDGQHFNLFDGYNYYDGLDPLNDGVPMYGQRRSLSTYARDSMAAARADATRGSVSQTFIVPSDAVALRFTVHGGRAAQIRLSYQDRTLYSATGNDADTPLGVVSWDLQPHRGKFVRLSIEDDTSAAPFGYVGCSGFDLVTAFNGP